LIGVTSVGLVVRSTRFGKFPSHGKHGVVGDVINLKLNAVTHANA